jgi:hypothetical protein
VHLVRLRKIEERTSHFLFSLLRIICDLHATGNLGFLHSPRLVSHPCTAAPRQPQRGRTRAPSAFRAPWKPSRRACCRSDPAELPSTSAQPPLCRRRVASACPARPGSRAPARAPRPLRPAARPDVAHALVGAPRHPGRRRECEVSPYSSPSLL